MLLRQKNEPDGPDGGIIVQRFTFRTETSLTGKILFFSSGSLANCNSDISDSAF